MHVLHTPDPCWRWNMLRKCVEEGAPPNEPYLKEFYTIIVQQQGDTEKQYALDLVRKRLHREILQAFFLCNSKLELISDTLKIEIDVLNHVKLLVADTSEFRNRLEHFSYVQELLENPNALTDSGKKYLFMAMTHGPEFMANHFNIGDEKFVVTPKKLIEKFIQTAYHLGANAQGNSVTADVTKQARLWMLDGVKYLEAYKDAEGGGDVDDDPLMAIEERKRTISVTDLDASPEDIIH